MEQTSTPYIWGEYRQKSAAELEEEKRLAEQAKNFKVTKLPYAGERRCLKFDKVNRNHMPRRRMGVPDAIGKGRISYADFDRMHLNQRVTANDYRLKFIPTFAASDDDLRLVIAQEGYDYARMCLRGTKEFYDTPDTRVPNGFVLNRAAIESLCTADTSR